VPDALSPILDVPVEIRVELGRKLITIGELLAAAPGHVVMLDRLADGGPRGEEGNRTRSARDVPLGRALEGLNWQLATGNWQLATGNWQLATGN
jgi:hypothetical protein